MSSPTPWSRRLHLLGASSRRPANRDDAPTPHEMEMTAERDMAVRLLCETLWERLEEEEDLPLLLELANYNNFADSEAAVKAALLHVVEHAVKTGRLPEDLAEDVQRTLTHMERNAIPYVKLEPEPEVTASMKRLFGGGRER